MKDWQKRMISPSDFPFGSKSLPPAYEYSHTRHECVKILDGIDEALKYCYQTQNTFTSGLSMTNLFQLPKEAQSGCFWIFVQTPAFLWPSNWRLGEIWVHPYTVQWPRRIALWDLCWPSGCCYHRAKPLETRSDVLVRKAARISSTVQGPCRKEVAKRRPLRGRHCGTPLHTGLDERPSSIHSARFQIISWGDTERHSWFIIIIRFDCLR